MHNGPDGGMTKSRRASWIALAIGASVSVFWLAVCARYLETAFGWDALMKAPAHELGLLVAGATAPLAFVWLVLLYLVRGFTAGEDVRALRIRIEALTYPAEGSAARVREITKSLKEQSTDLSSVSNEILGRLDAQGNAFRQRSQELMSASLRASSQTEQISQALDAQLAQIATAGERVEVLMESSRAAIERQIETLETAAAALGNLAEPVQDLREAAEEAFATSEELGGTLRART